MFIPRSFNMPSLAHKHQFIHEFGFGVIISSSLAGTHLPFVLAAQEGECGTLYTHCAKANPHWKELDGQQVLVIFTGPHSYISPSWYAKSPGVPTWNYSAVHASGTANILGDSDTLNAVEQLVSKYEPKLLTERDILTEQYQSQLLSGIVGLKIELTTIQGKQKLSQNRCAQDQQNICEALSKSRDLNDLALAKYMRKTGDLS